MTASRWLIETESGATYLIDHNVPPHETTHLLRWPAGRKPDLPVTATQGDRVRLEAEPKVGEQLVFFDDIGNRGHSTTVIKVTRLPAPVPQEFVEVLAFGEQFPAKEPAESLPDLSEVWDKHRAEEILARAAASPTVRRTRRRLGQ